MFVKYSIFVNCVETYGMGALIVCLHVLATLRGFVGPGRSILVLSSTEWYNNET